MRRTMTSLRFQTNTCNVTHLIRKHIYIVYELKQESKLHHYRMSCFEEVQLAEILRWRGILWFSTAMLNHRIKCCSILYNTYTLPIMYYDTAWVKLLSHHNQTAPKFIFNCGETTSFSCPIVLVWTRLPCSYMSKMNWTEGENTSGSETNAPNGQVWKHPYILTDP